MKPAQGMVQLGHIVLCFYKSPACLPSPAGGRGYVLKAQEMLPFLSDVPLRVSSSQCVQPLGYSNDFSSD